ncbi:MAG: hypothetical protein OEY20_09365 [Gemmatimonadota bacterium]|nr:hypothetical protein [Gemmatimonadota bacterium]MDH4352279.1 hypothetical protein [Gemmatimonadota bacterium]MDH5197449.1 hypothetical protein [Gemmatimonadota bacterium]
MKVLRMMTVLVGTVALGACAASQQQADAALKEAESAITAQHADAMRFAPDAFNAVMETYGAARTAYEAEDWPTVVAKAQEAAAQARQMAPTITEGKAQAAAKWPMMQDSVRAMLTALGARLDEVTRARRYPQGMTAADVRDARAQVDSLTVGLAKAVTAFDQGDLSNAMHAAERIRMQAGTLMGAVGLRPANPHGM